MSAEKQKEVFQYLNDKLKSDKNFEKNVNDLIEYYGAKFLATIQNSENVDEGAEIIEQVMYAQIYHGFYLQRELMIESDNSPEEERIFMDRFYTLPPGVMLNEIGPIMKKNFGGNYYMRKGNEAINIKVLNEFPNAFELYRAILLEVCNFGAYLAVLDYPKYEPSLENQEGYLLGNPFDLNILNPQIFMQAMAYSEQHEMWELYRLKNGENELQWYGTIYYTKIPDQDTTAHYLQFMISDLVRSNEKDAIIEKIFYRLPEDIQKHIQIRRYDVSNLDLLVKKA